MEKYVEINGIDVTETCSTWDVNEENQNAISTLDITFNNNVLSLHSLQEGDTIVVKRGLVTGQEETVFRGQVMQISTFPAGYTLFCNNRLQECIKKKVTKSWEQETDPEAGILTDIFITLVNNYTPLTISSSNVVPNPQTMFKLVCDNDSVWDIMNKIANFLNYQIRYEPSDDSVHFAPKGYTSYATTLEVGTNVVKRPIWKKDIKGMVNHVTINGATVFDDGKIQFFNGDGSNKTFQLLWTPEGTEVRIGGASGTILERGQKGADEKDYWIDVEKKQIRCTTAPASGTNNVYIKYGAQVPQPVIKRNQTSIDTYGGENQTAIEGVYTFPDLKSLGDAELKADDILNRFSTPFISTKLLVANDITDIEVGQFVNVVDAFESESRSLLVNKIVKKFPHVNDEIYVGDKIFRAEDWQTTIEDRLHNILKELNKNQDFIRVVYEFNEEIEYVRRYIKLQKASIAGDGFILGHPDFGILGTNKLKSLDDLYLYWDSDDAGTWDDFNWADDTATNYETKVIIQGQNIYQEDFIDEDFKDTTNNTANWSTTNKNVDNTTGTIFQTSSIFLDSNSEDLKQVVLTSDEDLGTGVSIIYSISADGGSNWQTITKGTTQTITNQGKDLRLKGVFSATTPLSTIKNIRLEYKI